jgi:hypothetical protein
VIPESAEILIELVSKRREVSVRYGRARLTVACWGQLGEGPMWEAVRSFRAGELTAEELCWTYVRRRVPSHTPSFRWADADLDRLLALVAEASREPELPTLPPEEFAAFLATTAGEERARREESVAQLMESIRPSYERLGLIGTEGARPAWQKNLAAAIKAQGVVDWSDTILTAKSAIFGSVRTSTPPTFGFGSATGVFPTPEERIELLRGSLFTGHEKALESLAQAAATFSGTLGAQYGADGKLLSDRIGSLGFGMNLRSDSAMEALRGQVAGFSFAGIKGVAGVEDLLPDFGWRREMQRIGEQIADAHRWRDAGTKWIEYFDRVLPRNWRGLDAKQAMRAGELMGETGIGLAWAPREEIVVELIEAGGHAERCRILEARCKEIVDDIEEVLDEIEGEDLAQTVEACRTAIAAFRAGFIAPAQSHLGTTLTDLAYRFFGDREFRGVRACFEKVNPRDDVGMAHYALYATGLGWVRVSVYIKNAGNDFNRHKTLHRLGDHHSADQFLSALLLITSLSRELDRAAGRGELEERGTGLLLAA